MLLFYRISLKNKKLSLLEQLAKYSFAIYFVHMYVIRGILFVIRRLSIPNNGDVFGLVVYSIVAMALSIGVVFVFRKIKWTRNIIGV